MFQKLAWLRTGLLAAAAFLPLSGAAAQLRTMVLEGGTLIDGNGGAPVPDAVVVVQGRRITAVGRKGQVRVPANASVINLAGRTILPGLIDSHTHTLDWMLPMFMPYGVTTIFDNSNDTAWILAQKEALNTGKIKGPRMFVAGTAMDGALGRGQFNYPALHTVEEVRARTRSNIAAGVDIVKVLQDFTDDQLSAAIEMARQTGLPAMGHTQNIRRAAELDLKFAEHTWTIAYALLDPEDKNPNLTGNQSTPSPESQIDPKTFPPLVDYLVKQGVYLNPTLVNTWRGATPRGQQFASEAAEIIKDPGLAFLPDDLKKGWTRIPRAPGGYDNVKEFLHEYVQAGGKMVVGTDTGYGGYSIPGLYEHYEMQMLVDIGYSPMQAIQAATLWNAQLLKKDKDLGSIAPGKIADFAIIEGDPLADISATKNIRMVIKDGEVIDTEYDPKWVNPMPEPFDSNHVLPPKIAKLTPSVVRQGGPTVMLEIEAAKLAARQAGFAPNSVVRFDTVDLPTQFVSSTKLTATLDARLLQRSPGSYALYVVTPGLYGSVSSAGYEVIDTADAPVGAIPQPYNVYARDTPQLFVPAPSMARQGGKTVTLQIEGTKFAPNAIVRFDTADLPTQFVSSTKLTAQLSAQLLQRHPGSYPLYVINPGPHGIVSEPGYFLVNLKQ